MFRKTLFSSPALAAFLLSIGEAAAHPGSHVGASHNQFFGGGEIVLLVAVAAAAVLLYNRRG